MTALDIKSAVKEAVAEVVPGVVAEAVKPLENKVDRMHSAFKMLLAQSGLDEDGGITPLNLVNIEGKTPPCM